jgi:RimJ/RimL family protein N-acetyltransferase
MMTPERSWRTSRLLARAASTEHAQVIFETYASDPAVAQFLSWTPHRDVDETTTFLSRCERVWADGSAFPWTLWLDDGEVFAGMLEARIRGHAMDLGVSCERVRKRRGQFHERNRRPTALRELQQRLAWRELVQRPSCARTG